MGHFKVGDKVRDTDRPGWGEGTVAHIGRPGTDYPVWVDFSGAECVATYTTDGRILATHEPSLQKTEAQAEQEKRYYRFAVSGQPNTNWYVLAYPTDDDGPSRVPALFIPGEHMLAVGLERALENKFVMEGPISESAILAYINDLKNRFGV